MAESADVLSLTAEIVSAYLGKSAHVQAADIPAIIASVRQALSETEASAASEPTAAEPAPKMHGASVKKSITPDALISFVDGKPYKTLKRHLARHGLDMAGYRERYGLPKDYPSVAPNYSAARSEMARKLGLGARGRGAQQTAEEPAAAPAADAQPAAAPAPKGRRKAAAAA